MNKELIKLAGWLVVGIAVLAAELILVRTPSNHKAVEMNATLDILRGKTKRGVEEIKIVKMEQAVDSLTAILVDIKDRLYPAESFSGLGDAIQKSGNAIDLKLVDIKPDYPKLDQLHLSTEDVVELPVTITMRGKFMQFAHFLERLSEFPYIKAVEVSIKHTENNEDTIDGIIYGLVVFKKIPVPPVKTKPAAEEKSNGAVNT